MQVRKCGGDRVLVGVFVGMYVVWLCGVVAAEEVGRDGGMNVCHGDSVPHIHTYVLIHTAWAW